MKKPKLIFEMDAVISAGISPQLSLWKQARRELYVKYLNKPRRKMFELVKNNKANTAHDVATIINRTIQQASNQLRNLVEMGWLNRVDLLSTKGVREYVYTAREY